MLKREKEETLPSGAGESGKPAKAEPAPQEAKPAAAEVNTEPLLSYIILSDLHVSIYDPNTIKHLKEALDDITHFESKVEAVIITGDITEYGIESDYKEFEKIIKGYKLPPVYVNMGNHDYYHVWIDKDGGFNKDTFPNGKTDAQSRDRFMKFFGLQKPFTDAKLGNYQFLMMSQETYSQEKPEVGEGAWYSDEQMNWLKTKIGENKDGKPVFVMIHQPLPPAGKDGGTHQLIRAKQFRETLKAHPNVFVFCGHRHQDFQNGVPHYEKETFHLFHNSSVGRVLNRQYENASKEKAQGLYVQVYQDKVTIRGREFPKKAWLKEADWTIPLTKV
ncbi:phosphohydrolase [Paenibacillus thalictri]|uniref:Phosphohydrolase n=2 Tax=Paenibacillus thalictri TaxID=2527873 RepID=A0A4Q9DP75_9BACL|nr:phosphohydrolase [Paenibacillus thalictri]